MSRTDVIARRIASAQGDTTWDNTLREVVATARTVSSSVRFDVNFIDVTFIDDVAELSFPTMAQETLGIFSRR